LLGGVELRPLVIVGAGELAHLAHYYFSNDSPRSVAGFAVDARYLGSTAKVMDLPVVAFEEIGASFPPAEYDLFVAIGYSRLNAARAEKCAAARSLGYGLANYVSSRASVWPDLELGDNCMIMEGNVIQPFVKIGNGAILFCGSILSHDVELGDTCFVASGATICGGVTIGSNCFIGANSTIREHVEIGEDCIIGAGALIVRDIPGGSGYVEIGTKDSGIPSRRLRSLL
jgi:sugar O-acyltransferase (sialic acid O-acetyltransferase NeuD family)